MQANPFLEPSRTFDAPGDDSDVSGEAEPAQTIIWREEALVVGPTPQKYGRILGLFDVSPAHLNLSPVKNNVASPSKKRKLDAQESVGLLVPSPSKLRVSPQKTPSFLKRQSTMTFDDAAGSTTSRLLFQAKPTSSLSAIIQQNRQWYDADTQDDDALEALRAAEAGEDAVLPVQDLSSEEDVAAQDTTDAGKVRWKKKGLKRSHRRVIMRPQAPKPSAPEPPSSDLPADAGSCTESDEEINDEQVAAKQHQPTMDEEVPEWLEKESLAIKEKAEARKRQQEAAQPKRKPRAAPANFKSLKLRNSGAKGGSRFGRGRFGGRR
jgi:hypothetical protein